MNAKIVVDGVFFQIGRSGIARVWLKLLQHWVQQGFGDRIVVVDRNRTCPRIEGIAYRDAPAFAHDNDLADRQALQAICDEEGAGLFISTYYTLPLTTPSAMLVYDMIPEVLGWNLQEPMWQQKQRALHHASHFAAISENSAKDVRAHLGRPDLAVRVAYTGSDFGPALPGAVESFKARHRIDRPYFMISGSRSSYKNVSLFFKAFATLGDDRARYAIVCTGGGRLEPEFATLSGPADVRVMILDDAEMQAAYSGAIALVYPSLYEGFGLPVLEAMACACPAITTRISSMPEVGGDAVLYVDVEGRTEEQMTVQMAQHLLAVQRPDTRCALVDAGRVQATRFRWDRMAEVMRDFLSEAAEACGFRASREGHECRLCGASTRWLFSKRLLNKHDVQFRQCSHCGATQTEKPYWLDEAYVPENERFDTGQVTRSLVNAAVVHALLPMAGLGPEARVVDYGCGSGLMVRALRDAGVDAWGYDRFATPRLALGFQTRTHQGFDVVNLCEVVERFDEPRRVFDEIFASDPALVVMQTGIASQITESWDYLATEHGQHIFFLSPTTVGWLCQTYGRHPVSVSGFQVLARPDVAQRLIDPTTGGLRVEHHQAVHNLLPSLWIGLFSRPYFHASQDNQRLRHAESAAQPA
jgi:glycosyltransferase involved in cell wall biosynthesis